MSSHPAPEFPEESAPARLLVAARACLVERGHAACSVKLIATQAGVNHGLVHHYFGSKEGLFAAMLDQLDQEMDQQSVDADNPLDLQEFLLDIVFVRAPLLNEIHGLARQHPQIRERFARFLERRRHQIGELLGLEDPQRLRLFTAMVQGLAMQSQVERNLPLYSLVESMVRLFGRQGGATPGPVPPSVPTPETPRS